MKNINYYQIDKKKYLIMKPQILVEIFIEMLYLMNKVNKNLKNIKQLNC